MIWNDLLLLKLVEVNGSLSLLLNRGLSHSQVSMLINKHVDEGNIFLTEEGIFLSNKGSELLKKNLSKELPRKKDQWILPQKQFYCDPISSDKTVLPKNKKI